MHQPSGGRGLARCPDRLKRACVVGRLMTQANNAHQSGLKHITGQDTEGDIVHSTRVGGQGTRKQLW